MMKRVFQILIWLIVLAGIGAALAFMQIKHEETICQGFELSIIDDNSDPLIDEASITAKIIEATDTLTGKTLGEIDLKEIHSILQAIPFVLEGDVQTNISGYLSIKVKLRKAIIRVVNKNGLNYFIDEDGWLLPVYPGFPSRVMIANGNINDNISKLEEKKIHYSTLNNAPLIAELYAMALHINQSPFLKKMISQVWVDRNGNYELIPMVGSYTVKLGDGGSMTERFGKLETFYREGAGKAGWIDYKTVDLRYENQIICSKK
ncbi:MAG: cell division protein FtsQ/DivIB [Bacteroidales bacterium]|nr:cell division protein FtsQ/DivIB [Bacteroidales bacterium]